MGSLSYIYDTQVENELNRTLNDTFLNNYGVHKARTAAIDAMQQEYKCCGAVRFEDWRSGVWLRSRRKDLLFPKLDRVVPDSCCFTMTERCGTRDHPSNIPYTVSGEFVFEYQTVFIGFSSPGLRLPDDGRDPGAVEPHRGSGTGLLRCGGVWTGDGVCFVRETQVNLRGLTIKCEFSGSDGG